MVLVLYGIHTHQETNGTLERLTAKSFMKMTISRNVGHVKGTNEEW